MVTWWRRREIKTGFSGEMWRKETTWTTQDTIKIDSRSRMGDVDFINLVQGRENLHALLNMWNFLTSWRTLSYCGTVHRRVGWLLGWSVSQSVIGSVAWSASQSVSELNETVWLFWILVPCSLVLKYQCSGVTYCCIFLFWSGSKFYRIPDPGLVDYILLHPGTHWL